ncbi:hypothetical protein PK35_02965 [Tamlana nanhaiensis]|uniref:Uncharacterized protein n=1 Tax=Neotamlana nanhaiensis TaxID=1382798 RepID=A0A0D7W7Q7_9FLAO|nr:hypothetical protein [Tamlana nanhaiensis]KJD34733.1 hypothetical protein PK35_02965 [Tamlana nanhaiensis]
MRLPVKVGTDISNLDPEFEAFKGVNISPDGPQDFSKGVVTYIIYIEGKGVKEYRVMVSKDHNPVLEGGYADPEVLYSHKTEKYYIYPTSDGFHNWSGTYFKTFSSDNFISSKDLGVMVSAMISLWNFT